MSLTFDYPDEEREATIIAHESGVADTIDPLAGSYFVEATTNEMEKKVVEIQCQ